MMNSLTIDIQYGFPDLSIHLSVCLSIDLLMSFDQLVALPIHRLWSVAMSILKMNTEYTWIL